MTANDVELIPENVKMTPFIELEDMDREMPIDENDKPITMYFPKCAPVKTDEELISSESLKQIKEMANNGGSIYLKIDCPFYYE